MKKIRRKISRVIKAKKESNNSYTKTVIDMKKAKKTGLSSKKYIKHKVWNLNETERKELVSKLDKIDKKRENIIKQVTKITNSPEKEIKKLVKEARNKGINASEFLKYRYFELNTKEKEELAKALKTKKENKKNNEEWYINVVMEKSGWDREKTIENLKFGKERGYTPRKFVTSGFCSYTQKELENIKPYEKPKKTENDEETREKSATLKKYRDAIMKEKKWNLGEYRLNYLKTFNNCGCSYSEYYLYNLYKLPDEKTKKYITQDLHIRMQLRYCEYRNGLKYFENKNLFNEKFKKFVRRKWFVNKNLSYEDFKKNIKDLDEIIYKPLDLLAGEGVKKYKVNTSEATNKKVYKKIVGKEEAIIEECIVQDDKIAEFWPKTVNSIRIMTLCKDGKVHILNSVIKFGTGEYADNLAQGGIAAGIDIKKGEICTDGVNKKGEVFKKHPNSNVTFKGFKIPHWNKVIKECEKAAKVIKDMPYIGWDISITKDGNIEIIEGNHNQAGFLVQYPFAILEHEGKRDTIEPFLWFDKNK